MLYLSNLLKNTKYIFWPDLASTYYSNKPSSRKIKIFRPNVNFFYPNYSNIRCIEDFWSLIKGEVYKDGWEADNLD